MVQYKDKLIEALNFKENIMDIVTKRNVFLGAVGVAVTAVLLFAPTQKAEAFFGDSDSNGNWFGDSVGSFYNDTNGTGKGKGSASGNFSMNINASGKADTYAYADMDNAVDTNGGVESLGNTDSDVDEFYRYY